jgi:hypothetical protein
MGPFSTDHKIKTRLSVYVTIWILLFLSFVSHHSYIRTWYYYSHTHRRNTQVPNWIYPDASTDNIDISIALASRHNECETKLFFDFVGFSHSYIQWNCISLCLICVHQQACHNINGVVSNLCASDLQEMPNCALSCKIEKIISCLSKSLGHEIRPRIKASTDLVYNGERYEWYDLLRDDFNNVLGVWISEKYNLFYTSAGYVEYMFFYFITHNYIWVREWIMKRRVYMLFYALRLEIIRLRTLKR